MPETTAKPPHAEVHHPATVGSTFMRQYYHLLAKEPGSLHRFYKDESTWCHGVGSHMQDAITGQKAINDEILRRGYAGARVDLDIGSIDCQPSLHGGVFVLVTGVMTLASNVVPKPFVQTFFLAVQPNGYFVLNDCLRFLELPGASAADAAVQPTDAKKQPAQAAIGTPVAAASPAPKSKPVTPVVKKDKAPASPAVKPVVAETPVSPVKIKSPVQPKVASPKAAPAAAAAPASPVKKAAPAEAKTTPKPSETKPATPASPAVASAAAAPAAATPTSPTKPTPAAPAKPAEPVAPPAPKTWAALFSGAPAAAAAPAAAPKPAPVAAAAKPTPASAAPTDAIAKTAEAAAATASAAPQDKEKKRLYSLYIRDVPPQTKESDLRELFKSYGAIASVGVPAGRGIAFVDYREEDAMRAALADDKEFKLFDKVIHVEERKDKERSGFRADTRGGRGGGRGPPKSGRGDGKERRDANGKAPGAAAANGPRSAANNGDRRDKGGRRSGKEDGGRGRAD